MKCATDTSKYSEKTDTLNETESHLITTTPKSPFKSTQRLKTIHWKPIGPEKIAESIWSKIDQNWSDFDPKVCVSHTFNILPHSHN